jgi:hypothetical protein
MRIHQWVPAAHKGDAIGDSSRRMRGLLRAMGHESEIFAMTIDDDLRHDVQPFSDAAARRGDVTIFHYALPSAMSAAFASLPHGRKNIKSAFPPLSDLKTAVRWLLSQPSPCTITGNGRNPP